MQDARIKTPQTHPTHEVVGEFFVGWPHAWYCDSYDPQIGFWMTFVGNVKDGHEARERTNVSERAIDRTLHTVHQYNDYKTQVAQLARAHFVPDWSDEDLLDYALKNLGWKQTAYAICDNTGYETSLFNEYRQLQVIKAIQRHKVQA